MANIEITASGTISWSTLKDYHETAKGLYQIKVSNDQPLIEENYIYTLTVNAEGSLDAEEKFNAYIAKLNELGVFYHHVHLNYIVSKFIEFEGNFIKEEALSSDFLYADLLSLRNLISISLNDDLNRTLIEFTHKEFRNRDYPFYIKISNPAVIRAALDASIVEQFNSLKNNQFMYSYEFNEQLMSMETADSESVDLLMDIAVTISRKAFQTQLLFTICQTLLNYLAAWSPLNPNGVFATNDQLRVIWHTCKLHNLIKVDYEGYEPSEINYIRSVLTNRSIG